MRRGGWIFAALGTLLFAAAVLVPAFGAVAAALSAAGDRSPSSTTITPGSSMAPSEAIASAAVVRAPAAQAPIASLPFATSSVAPAPGTGVLDAVSIHDRATLVVQGFAWALGIAIAAATLGWLPGRAIRDASRGRAALLVATIAPACLPAYLVSWCWWQSVPPGSAIADWAIHHDATASLRVALLALGLVCWSWPLAALAVAALGRTERAAREAMAVDGARRLDRCRLALHEDARGLVVGGLVVALAVFGNTTAFDLAQVRSFGFELRTLDARGASSGDVIRAAWPAFVGSMAAVALLALATRRSWRAGASRGVDPTIGIARSGPDSSRTTRAPSAGVALLLALVALGAVLPLGLMVARLRVAARVSEFLSLYGEALGTTLAVALASGALAAIVACGGLVMALDRRRAVRRMADVVLVGWLAAASMPAMVVAAGFIAAYNREGLRETMYDRPWIVPLGQMAAFGVVGAFAGRFVAARVESARRDQMRLDDAGSLRGLVTALRPELVATAISAAAIVGALSLGEIVVTARIAPPGVEALAASVLNAIHYQDPETAMLATIVLLAAALLAALVVATVGAGASRRERALRRRDRRTPGGVVRSASASATIVALLLVAMIAPSGCRRSDDMPVVPTTRLFGAAGVGLGQFEYPRALAVDAANGFVYVIDKTARVQRFGLDGVAQASWSMPESALGKPTGVSVGPDGTVWVADTHYHRVIAFDRDGREKLRFGEYGMGPGQFVYPGDVAVAPNGELYVSEYGGNDRVQVFAPDGTFRRELLGGGYMSRPQSMGFSPDGAELFVTDACNHRIVVADLQGNVIRTFGQVGANPGDLSYPYGLHVLSDGTLLVAEFGGNRVQRLSPTGQSLGRWGGFGFERGKLRWPWGVAAVGSTIFVLDSGNNRVQAFELP